MRIGRTLPPAATPIDAGAVASGIRGIFRGQPELNRFESELKEHFGVEHCFLVSSGKAAFTLILLALHELFPDRDQVLLPAFTCYSVPSSVVRAGLRIRLCDQRTESFDFDFARLSAMLLERADLPGDANAADAADRASRSQVASDDGKDERPSQAKGILAVVPTHLFGYPSDVTALRKLIRDSGVTIVEDAAQAMGETVDGRKIGTLGEVSFFSLARGKAFSVVEGGIILTNRSDIAKALNDLVSRLPRYGLLASLKLIFKATALILLIHPKVFWVPRSMPFLRLGETLFETDFPILKMSSFQAGLARNWREKLEKLGEARKDKVNRWLAMLETNAHRHSVFLGRRTAGLLRFPFRVTDDKKRASLLQESMRSGLGIMPVYPTSINAIPELGGMIQGGEFPVAESFARELVTLPTHEYVTQQDMAVIAKLLSHVNS